MQLRRGCRSMVPAVLLLCTITILFGIAVNAHGEGSRSLYPATYAGTNNARANLDLSAGAKYANVVRRSTFLYVYAQAGEYIVLGSRNRSTTGTTTGDISVYNPQSFGIPGDETIPGAADFSCSGGSTQSGVHFSGGTGATTTGLIADRAQELAGPNSADNSVLVSGGFRPCAYQAPQTGVYGVVFTVAGAGGGPNGSVDPPATSTSTVSAWDVTVRADATSVVDLNGRLFTYAFAGYTGCNSCSLYSTLYYITQDGYRYKQRLTGLDPNQYALYANSLGFLDNGNPLYKDLRGNQQAVTTLPVGVTSQIAQYPIFFSDASAGGANAAEITRVLTALGIPLVPPSPVVSNMSFVGNITGSRSTVGAGGVFRFDTTDTITYQIVISVDGIDFNPENINNRTLTGVARTGSHTVTWDGKNNNAVNFPAGGPYPFSVSGRNGETHFPIIDSENNFFGGPEVTRLNGVGAPDTTVYYDDRGYLTRSGILVGTLNGLLCPIAVPAPPVLDLSLNGVDSSTAYRTWGVQSGTGGATQNNDCTATSTKNDWGDAKGVDLWTFYSVTPPVETLTIIPVVIDAATSVGGPGTAAPGSTVQGAFRFENNGTGSALNVTYSMSLSPGLGTVTFGNLPTGTTASYDNITGVVTFGGTPLTTTLTPGQTVLGANPAAPMTYSYTAPASGTITVTTGISTASVDDYPGNNTAFISTGIGEVDVIAAVSVPAGAAAGDTVAGTFTFANNGAGLAAGVTYAVTIGSPGNFPSAVSFTTLPFSVTASYDNTTGAVTFGGSPGLPATLASGQSYFFGFTYTAPIAGSVPVNALITTTSSDANGANNTSTGTTVVLVADVTTTVTAPAEALPGGTVNVPVSFGNVGQLPAAGVTYGASLPPGLSGVSCAGATCSYNGLTGAVDISGLPGSLSSGQTVIVTLSYTAPASGSVVVGSAITTTTNQGVNAAPDSASGTTTVNAGATSADVTTSLTPPATAVVGSTVNVPVSFTNLGPATAAGVTYGATLPAGLGVGAVSCSGPVGLSCAYDNVTGAVAISGLPATLISGQAETITLSYTAPGVPGTVSITSTIGTSTGQGSNIGPDSATGTTGITAAAATADVSTTVAPPASAIGGSTVNVPITFTNNGPATASGVTYGVTMPAGLGVGAVSCSGPAGLTCAYDNITGAVTISGLPVTLTSGQTISITLSYTAPANGAVTIGSAISTATTDSNPGNNTASSTTTITALADLTIAKTHTGNFTQGQTGATYSITVTNSGAGSTTGLVTVTETPPAGLTVTGLSGTGWSCVLATLTCTRSDVIASGLSYPAITVTVDVAGNAAPIVTNSASVSGGGELNAGNNTASDPTTVTALADAATAMVGPVNAAAGSTVNVQITCSNLGPSAAAGMSYTLTLNPGLGGVSCVGSGVSCVYDPVTGIATLSGLPPTLTSGQSVLFTLSYTAPASGSVTVQAVISTTTTDPNLTNNSAAGSTTITALPTGGISGVVFSDINGNGVQDAGEPGLPGVTINLLDNTNAVIATTASAADGTYVFAGIVTGNYTVVETDPAGFVSTTPNTVAVNVTAGGTAPADFGDAQTAPATGSVTGRVFNDINGNGVQDEGEPALPGVTINLLDNANAVIATTTTDGNGNYVFVNLLPGQYTVSQTVPPGFVGTTNTVVSVTVTPQGAATAVFGDVQGGAVPVPTMTEWGMMLFFLIAGGISAYRLRRQSAQFLSGA